jgi:hypothetical protein
VQSQPVASGAFTRLPSPPGPADQTLDKTRRQAKQPARQPGQFLTAQLVSLCYAAVEFILFAVMAF